MTRPLFVWSAYGLFGLLLVAYSALGAIASRTVTATIKLVPGEERQIEVLRLNEGPLRLRALFSCDASRQVPLGCPPEVLANQALKSSRFEIAASVSGRAVGVLAVGEVEARGNGIFERRLIAPENSAFRVGMNTISISVVSVDAPIIGESVEIHVLPALGFKSAESSVDWLWFYFFDEFYLPIYCVLGLIFGLWRGIARSRRRKGQHVDRKTHA